ncbi:methyl-accepting chemotaxis protein [Azohydromonas lata]|uniref:Methyl-accepting chemotaxis protein n=1 Tax=Azohydromonas lata TaxID=45677 RepID=A0ABU5IE61_9BURK|nr:methyl-accepting chemotaxis protein [Azohydromonas lata]MDZ5457407.1 methyl-accepting chemotaxis protein [Azohydromonas lata]
MPPATASGTSTRSTHPSTVPAFFLHHGLMAPGMRLFRSVGFPAKATAVSLAFLVPLLLLAFSFWSVSTDNIAFSAAERRGVEYARALMSLLDAAQNRRRAATAGAPDLPKAQQAVQAAWDQLLATHERLGTEFKLQERWQTLQAQAQQLASQPQRDQPAATFAVHSQFIAEALDLLSDMADASNLTLDPDIDTYYLMRAGVDLQPRLAEVLGRMRGAGNAALRSGQLGSEQRDQIASALAFATMWELELGSSVKRALRADEGIAAEVRLDEALKESTGFMQRVREQVLAQTPQGDAEAFVALGNRAVADHYAGIERVLASLDKRLALRVDRLQQAMWVKLGVSAAGIAIALYLLLAFYRVTLGGLDEIARQLRELSHGNLTLHPQPWGRDEVAQLMSTLAATLDALRGTVAQVRTGASEIDTASREVAMASMDLSKRTEQGAAQLQRTAAAMSQIGQTLNQSAGSAASAAGMVAHNAQVAQQGSEVVAEAVRTMGGIRDSSQRIAEIVGTIDGIAFQTNILALNAAVEAARAGEAGRGFAVVAAEVRALAQRSGAAAREIKQLIEGSVARVQEGSEVVTQAGATMTDIVGHAERIKDLIQAINHGTAEQTQGLQEVGHAVEQLDAMTQQNATLVEQTAAAASTLSTNARRLNEEVAFFRLP